MILPFRQFGLIEGIIWLSKRFQEKQVEERVAWERWMGGQTTLKYLSRAAARAFEDECSGKDGWFTVKFTVQSPLVLEAVVKKLNDGSVRDIRISRVSDLVDSQLIIECPCKKREEFGFPCARATQMLLESQWNVTGAFSSWFSRRLLSSTWRAQSLSSVFVPDTPDWLRSFPKRNPSQGVAHLLLEADGGPNWLLPARIHVQAGRPSDSSNN